MKTRLEQMRDEIDEAILTPQLATLVASPLAERNGAIVLAPLLESVKHMQADPADLSGFEALANKIHIDDFTTEGSGFPALLSQGFHYAETLARRLKALGYKAQVVLSCEPDAHSATARFVILRDGAGWIAGDLDSYQHDAIAVWTV